MNAIEGTIVQRAGHYRWVIAALLVLANIINYLDRSALSVVAPLLTRDLGLDPASLGLVFSAFFTGYAIFCFIGGWASDRFGPRIVFSIAMLWWSVFCGATALATGFASLLVVRFLFGIGEGPMGTNTSKTITNWFPREEAATTFGICLAGNNVGAALAGPIVGLVAVGYGWRISFLVITLIGFVWLGFWWWLATDTPFQNKRAGQAERSFITQSQRAAAGKSRVEDEPTNIGHWLRSPTILCIAAAFFSASYVLYFLLTWIPTYLTDVHHLDTRRMSILTVIPWLCGSIGLISGGAASDLLLRKLGKPILARKIVIVVALCMAAVSMVAASQAQSLELALGLIAIGLFFVQMAPLACFVLIQEIVPATRVGTVGGFVHLLANLAGIIGPALTGFLIKYGGGFGSSFVLAGVLALGSSIAVLFGVQVRQTRLANPAV